jgi:hypothetical protein
MRSNDELYIFVEELMKQLEGIDEREASDRLRQSMYISSSLTEVFFALRHQLTEILQSSIHLDPDVREKIQEAIGSIGRALR